MTGVAGRPVLNQRFVHAIKAPTLSEAIQQHTFVVLGSSDAARTFFKSKGLRMSERVDQLSPGSHVVVIWNVTHLTEEGMQSAKALCDFASRGGKVVVLSTPPLSASCSACWVMESTDGIMKLQSACTHPCLEPRYMRLCRYQANQFTNARWEKSQPR